MRPIRWSRTMGVRVHIDLPLDDLIRRLTADFNGQPLMTLTVRTNSVFRDPSFSTGLSTLVNLSGRPIVESVVRRLNYEPTPNRHYANAGIALIDCQLDSILLNSN